MSYCHHCGHHAELHGGPYCAWCAQFFYTHGRMPKPGDYPPETALARVYAAMGWDVTNVRDI